MQHSGQKYRISLAAALAATALLLQPCGMVVADGKAAAAPHNSDVTWLSSLNDARALSVTTGKLILVDFSATWCGPCQAMITETFPDPAVQPLLKNLICVRVDVDQDPTTAAHFDVDGIPRVLLLDSNPAHAPRMDRIGYEDANTFANQLRSALGMPPLPGSDIPAPINNPIIYTVAEALADDQYAELKIKDKATALAGLQQIVAQLGERAGDQLIQIQPGQLARAGSDAYSALIAGMKSKYLSDRVGAYSMFEHLYGSAVKTHTFDPWAKTTTRQSQLTALEVAPGKSN